MNLILQTVAKMCGGQLSPFSNPQMLINSVVIDSRSAVRNSLFVAIRGENQDGHLYVKSCLDKCIGGAIVARDCNLNLPNLIYVDDTVKALGLLAAQYRLQFDIPLVAITGSNGKTTVKEMLKSICKERYGEKHVLATTGNLNNHIGMPLMLLQLTSEHKVAIIEMGMNHAGELNYLSSIAKPTIAIVNNVMLAHAGFFRDLNDIARAKGEIYNGLIQGGIACIDESSQFAAIFRQQLKNVTQVLYGDIDGICYIKDSGAHGAITLATKQGDIKCNLKVLGEHNKTNAVTAATLAIVLGCSASDIANGLENYTGFKGRLEQKTAFNGALIIDDSYNANPDSVKAAILAVEELPKPHWFIFADLKELGDFTRRAHEEIADFAMKHGIDCLLTVGSTSKITNSEFKGNKMHFEQNLDIVEYCKEHLPTNATLLVKGSNSMNLAQIVAKLIK